MWILPDGTIISSQIPVVIGDTQYSKRIFTRWSLSELNDIGIYTYTENTANRICYSVDTHSDIISDGHCHRTHVFVPALENADLRRLIRTNAKTTVRGLWRDYKAEENYLLECDPDNTVDIDACQNMLNDLKQAVVLIKADIQALASYDEAADYYSGGIKSRLPGGDI
jgi:hypothetical protein